MLGLLLLISPSIFAQGGFTLTWDSEVGCLEYDYDKKRNETVEGVADEDCILVCEESFVTFDVEYGTQQVTDISWETDGGVIESLSNSNATAEISWPLAYTNGSVTAHITLANGQEFDESICVTVKTKPQGGFEIIGQQSPYFCSNVDLYFDNLAFMLDGTQIISSLWDFGDGTYSNDFNPSHSYDQAGNYEITLTVYDECGCSNAWKKQIVITKPGIVISCPTPVCEGTLETYTLEGPAYMNGDVECSTFQWDVIGGQLVGQGQGWIDVLWDSVDEDGFGYVYFDQNSCNVQCDNTLVVEIPVIATSGTIQGGNTELCQSEQSRYGLPRWPTTDIDWQVVNVNNPGTFIPDATILVDQRNEIVVDASVLDPGNYILQANYVNTLLKCGGEAEFQFTVLQDLQIDENQLIIEICEGNSADFTLVQTISGVTWSFIMGGQTIATVSGSGSNSSATYQFTEPGHYTVSATANGYCTDYAEIDVVEIPSVATAAILGSIEICPLVGEEYTFDGETGGFDVVWSVVHGEFLGPNIGETVTIKFLSGFTGYEVSANLVNPNFDNCESDSVILPVEIFVPQAQIVQTSGNPNAICTSSEESFELQGYSGMDNYEWSILPEELGHVSAGEGTENVNILFNEPYLGQTQGTITVRAKVCGVMAVVATSNFELDQAPVLTITSSPAVTCPQSAFTIGFNIGGLSSIPLSFISLTFDGISNAQIPQPTSLGGGNYQYNGILLPNVDPFDPVTVSFNITVDGPDLCTAAQTFGSLQLSPAPDLQVSRTGGGSVFCYASDINTILTANFQGSGFQQSNIYWTYQGNPLNVQGATLDIGLLPSPDFGFYTAQAVNSPYGCTTLSTFEVEEDCTDILPSCLNESATVTGTWSACEMITLTANYTGNPVSVSFLRDNGFTDSYAVPLPPTDNNNILTQQFETNASGTYIFGFRAEYANCAVDFGPIVVEVEYDALLNIDVQCQPNNYEVSILNQSTYTPGSSPDVAYTYFLNPSGPTTSFNSSNPNEATTLLPNGNYTLTLTLSSTGKPTCEISTEIELQLPDASFNIAQNPVCAEDLVVLQPDNPTLNATYLWEFQDASNTLENINPTLAGTIGGPPAEIILTVTDPFGCSDMADETIVVNEPAFQGEIFAIPGNDICPSQDVDLDYMNNGFGTPDSYAWLKDQNLIGATNISLNDVVEPGEYSINLFDALGCRYAGISSVFINQIQPPHLSAEITTSVCVGDAITLTGTLSPNNTEYQISRAVNGGGYNVVQTWTPGPTINATDPNPSVGNYAYKVEYKDLQTECTNEAIFNAVVNPLPTVSVQLSGVSCTPYTLHLTASGNQAGTYNWSNGMSGATITVDHGGPYQVRFQPTGAECQASATIIAPKSPEEYTWIFPTGCFDYCNKHYPMYIIGPIPSFSGGYSYDLYGNPVNAGIGIVPDLPFTNGLQGELTLSLDNGFCGTTTDVLNVTEFNCKDCDVRVDLQKFTPIEESTGFVYYEVQGGAILNPYNFAITITLSSPDGTFIPSAITVPPNTAIQFPNFALEFIPNGAISGGIMLEYVVNGNYGQGNTIFCQNFDNIDPSEIGQLRPAGKSGGSAKMNVVPNPVISATVVHYTIEDVPGYNGGTMNLYSLNGNLVRTRNIQEAQGKTSFDLSGLASGTYVVVFFSQGQRIGQQVIIKN